jgi:hypothetical protein
MVDVKTVSVSPTLSVPCTSAARTHACLVGSGIRLPSLSQQGVNQIPSRRPLAFDTPHSLRAVGSFSMESRQSCKAAVFTTTMVRLPFDDLSVLELDIAVCDALQEHLVVVQLIVRRNGGSKFLKTMGTMLSARRTTL